MQHVLKFFTILNNQGWFMQMLHMTLITELKNKIVQKLAKQEKFSIKDKHDLSPVTELDQYLSKTVKDIFLKARPELNFYCEEEEERSELNQYPLLVLDPLDGTHEFVRGLPECALSLAILESADIMDPRNFAFIYNPFTGFEIHSYQPFQKTKSKDSFPPKSYLVSRSEWESGLIKYDNFPNALITPRGSIAFKLGLLASGACDGVITLRPKNLWDICAGTILCVQRGFHFYQNGEIIQQFTREHYNEILEWSHQPI